VPVAVVVAADDVLDTVELELDERLLDEELDVELDELDEELDVAETLAGEDVEELLLEDADAEPAVARYAP